MRVVPLSDGSGAVIRHADVDSRYVMPRNVDVWLPPGYDQPEAPRYPVLYMHDGQNIFDPALASTGVDWGADEAVTRYMQDTGRPGAIVVGVWNTPLRRREYMPARPLAAKGAEDARAGVIERLGGPPLSDDYLSFLVNELKPFIDATYRTLPDQPNTLIMGSSMGGLISAYALSEYPQVFSGAGCLSTHWPIGGDLLVRYFGAALPPPGSHRLYFDFGTVDLDEQYEPFQRKMDALLRERGYREGQDWRTLKFEGANHSEQAWRARVDIPLRFLFGV